jgi:hypothetical protein
MSAGCFGLVAIAIALATMVFSWGVMVRDFVRWRKKKRATRGFPVTPVLPPTAQPLRPQPDDAPR